MNNSKLKRKALTSCKERKMNITFILTIIFVFLTLLVESTNLTLQF